MKVLTQREWRWFQFRCSVMRGAALWAQWLFRGFAFGAGVVMAVVLARWAMGG